MRLFYSIIMIAIVFSCQNKTETAKTIEKETTSNEISAKDISELKYTDYVLDAEAKNILMDWQRFQELNLQLGYLKQGDLNFFKNQQEEVKTLFDSLKVNIPEPINVKPIVSRITVLETKSLKLHTNLTLNNIEKATKLASIKEVLVAHANLILQINKKIEYDANVYERPN
ncbi:hypothetical protein [Paucihalobacter sp.]|uniref:hypothetical protein n=1 Tax=Paucihalobacter sp. TaxID=2850405 RepID=UPI002FDF5C65